MEELFMKAAFTAVFVAAFAIPATAVAQEGEKTFDMTVFVTGMS